MEDHNTREMDRAIVAILRRHGLEARSWTRLDSLGLSTTIYLLGDDYVLRIPHQQPEAIAAIRTDPIVIPAARNAGVRTPQMIVFDDRCDILPLPYGVYERAHGEPLDRLSLPRDRTPDIWHELGRDLALLHRNVSPHGSMDQIRVQDEIVDPFPWLREIVASALVTTEESIWLERWLGELAPFVQLAAPRRLCHGDANGSNIIVDPATRRYVAVLDWGGAFWGDATWDFAPVSLLAVPFMLDGYRSIGALDNDATAEARILWHHVVFAIFGVWKQQRRGRLWAKGRIARLRQHLAVFLAAPNRHWIAELYR